MADWTGIHRHGNGYRAVVSHGRGRPPIRRWFPLQTPLSVMQDWRKDEYAKARLLRHRRATMGAFDHDAETYLHNPDVKQMPSYQQRCRDIRLWAAAFGRRDRSQITPALIMQIRNQWAVTPRSDTDPRPVTPSTINRRLTALSHLWRVLDGRNSYNPLLDVDKFKEPAPRPRHIAVDVLSQILDAMRTSGYGRKGEARPPQSKAHARVCVLATTGLPSGTLKKLRREDVDLARATMLLPPRRKGDGAPAALLPLSPAAVDAFRRFDRLGCWGAFNVSAMARALRTAAIKVTGQPVNPYQLRHSFATELAQRTGDETAVAYLLQHRSTSTTRKYYTVGSHFDRARQAVGTTVGQLPRIKLDEIGRMAEPVRQCQTARKSLKRR